MSTAFPYLPQDELAGPEDGSVEFPYGTLDPKTGCTDANAVEAALAKRTSIYNELEGTSAACFALEQSWVRLGLMLSEFKAREHWRPLGYTTFDDFISELKDRFKRGRTQLYSYLGVAEQLLPVVSAEKLEAMGISKAQELRRTLKLLAGKPLPPELVDAALQSDKTAKELRVDIGAALNFTPEEKGTWFDFGGCFLLPDERKEFREAVQATEGILEISSNIPDHIRRKEVILTWMREWYATWSPEFYGKKEEAPDHA